MTFVRSYLLTVLRLHIFMSSLPLIYTHWLIIQKVCPYWTTLKQSISRSVDTNLCNPSFQKFFTKILSIDQ